MMHSISSQAPQGSRWLWRALAGLALLMLAALLTAAVLLWVNRASLRNWLRPQLSRWGLERVVVREVKVPVMVEKKVEVIREVPVADPLPSQFVPRQEVDVASLFNGIEIATELKTLPGGFASLERLNPKAYQAQFQLQVRVPKANASMEELSRIDPQLRGLLPDLQAMLPTARVSGFFHRLYENKAKLVQRDLTRLNRALDRHNFYDCETILELTHPQSMRKALLIQSEMDVVCDGSDGDRMPVMQEAIHQSDYYQPFTSYAWGKRGKVPNPLLSRWQQRLDGVEKQMKSSAMGAEKLKALRQLRDQLRLEISDMKSRSSLVADLDPFIVLSLVFRGQELRNAHTPQMGDYAVVIHNGRMFPAICGDYGPSAKMGEASLLLAQAVNNKATPYRRPESDLRVSYVVFPGTARKPNGPPDLLLWQRECASLLKELGCPNAASQLHAWKPEPVFCGPPWPVPSLVQSVPPAATPPSSGSR